MAAINTSMSIKTICSYSNKDAKEVQSFSYSGKNVEILEDIRACSNLERLDIARNQIVIADGISHLPKLKWLNISKNHICSLGFASKLFAMQVLNAGHNEIKDVKPLKNLSELNALILNNNQINQPLKFPCFKILNTLVLSHNAIEELDVTLLPNLIKLQLSHNKISSFPDISRNIQLKQVSFNSNKIKSIPEKCIGNDHLCLEIFDVGKNEIMKFKYIKSLCQIRSLKKANFKGNLIEQDPNYSKKILHLFPELTHLDASPVEKLGQPEKRKHADMSEASSTEQDSPQKKKLKKNLVGNTSSTTNQFSTSTEDINDINEPASDKKRKKTKHNISKVLTNDETDITRTFKDTPAPATELSSQNSATGIMKSKRKKDKSKKEASSESGVLAVKVYKKYSQPQITVDNLLTSLHTDLGSGASSSW